MGDKMSKEDMIKEAVEEAKAEAAKMQEEGDAADSEETAAEETENTANEDASEEAEESQETKDTDPKEKKKFFGKKEKKDKKDEKIEELTDRLTRQMAEFDNFRKRTEREKSQMYEIGAKDIIEKILPVIDNFELRSCRRAGRGQGRSFRRRDGEDLQTDHDNTGRSRSKTDRSSGSGI